jgi:hypothetical protein
MDFRGTDQHELVDQCALIAQYFEGWTIKDYEEWPGSFVSLLWDPRRPIPRGRDYNRRSDGTWVPWDLPNYAMDLNACGRAELGCALRNQWFPYYQNLILRVVPKWDGTHDDLTAAEMFAVVSAPAKLRFTTLYELARALQREEESHVRGD